MDLDSTPSSAPPTLGDRVPPGGIHDTDGILDLFLGWVHDQGLELYPAQEEAILELLAGRHVVLNTPTGSGKSMVALALHFKAMCEGRRCFYTTPIKALASEKFFDLCDTLGAANVGMQTGDASINADAPIICCTAEVLSNLALRRGANLNAPYAVLDEFHYYGDRDRGVAWQVPLLCLEQTTFLLMSATLGNTAAIEESLTRVSGREVARVVSFDRPVPLDYDYRETPLHLTIEGLERDGKVPIYVVNFTQRQCAELAQDLTSLPLTKPEEKRELRSAIGNFRFDTPYGKELHRLLRFGIGVHHAGLLPKYRLLVEQLSQRGLLKVICGTDTLGVGVNVPIRTVLFTQLSKFNGRETTLLSVRDFQQIAGRAGRKGFDVQGSVVCQAPEHEIENQRRAEKAGGDPRKLRKLRKKDPPRGFVPWTRKTFESLAHRPPETLQSRFKVTHSMVLDLIQRDAEIDDPDRDNFTSLREIIARCHESDERKRELLTEAAILTRSMYRAGIVKMHRDSQTGYGWVVVDDELQFNFSLHQTLALFLIEALDALDAQDPEHSLHVLSLTEAILENPSAVLYRQVDKAREDLRAELRDAHLSWEEKRDRLDRVSYPKPMREFLDPAFALFRSVHPWIGETQIHPKSIGRELWENYSSFNDYIRLYGLHRSEGLLLRYIGQLYKTLLQTVPEPHKSDAMYDIEAFLRTLIEHTDSSLLQEWEALVHPEIALQNAEQAAIAQRALHQDQLLVNPKVFTARVRAEMHQIVRALSVQDYEEAAATLRPDPDHEWTPGELEAAMAPFYDEHAKIDFSPGARHANSAVIEEVEKRLWRVSQTLPDPEGDNLWCLDGRIDLRGNVDPEGGLFHLDRIGT